jgi:hypothetical protein
MTEALYLIRSIQPLKMTVKRDDKGDKCYTPAVRIVLKQENWFLKVVLARCVRWSCILKKYTFIIGYGVYRRTVNKLFI